MFVCITNFVWILMDRIFYINSCWTKLPVPVVHGAGDPPHPRLELPEVPGAADLLRHAAAGAGQHHPHPAQGLHLTPQDGPVILQVLYCTVLYCTVLFCHTPGHKHSLINVWYPFWLFLCWFSSRKGAFQLLHKLSFHASIAKISLKRLIKDILRECPCHLILFCISKHKGC